MYLYFAPKNFAHTHPGNFFTHVFCTFFTRFLVRFLVRFFVHFFTFVRSNLRFAPLKLTFFALNLALFLSQVICYFVRRMSKKTGPPSVSALSDTFRFWRKTHFNISERSTISRERTLRNADSLGTGSWGLANGFLTFVLRLRFVSLPRCRERKKLAYFIKAGADCVGFWRVKE